MVEEERRLPRASSALALFVALGCGGKSLDGDDTYGAGSTAARDMGAIGAAAGSRNATGSCRSGEGVRGARETSGVRGATPNGDEPGTNECLVVYPNLELTECEALERFVSVHDAVIDDANGDGRASAGETITISVTFSETSGATFVAYPGIDFESRDAGITLARPGFAGPAVYAMGACESVGGSVGAKLSEDLLPGSVVRVGARAASLNRDCPNATELVIPISIEARSLCE